MTTYVVITQDGGDWGLDWSVTEVVADDLRQALERAVKNGYGQADGLAWVFPKASGSKYEFAPKSALQPILVSY